MRRSLLSFLIIFYLPAAAANGLDYRVLSEISTDHGQAQLIVREDGHLVGQPFQVELRVNCHNDQGAEVTNWPIQDSFSVCDLDPNSPKINRQKTAIALKTKMVDMKSYNDQIAQGNIHPQAKCEDQTKIKKISLRNICHH